MAISKLILNGEVQMDVTSDTVTAGSMLSGTTATKNDGTKATGTIVTKTSSDLTVSGATVTAPAGYYANAASKAVATTTHPNPTASIASSTGVITASHTQTAGYVTAGTTTGALNLTTQAGKTVTPTETAQTAVASYRWTTGTVSVAAISSTYVGTGVTTRSAANLTASGSTVTAPAGYYSSAVSKAVAAGSAFPPAVTITKAPTFSMNSATGVVTASYTGSSSITPTVTSGWVSNGTAGTISTTGTSTYQLTSKAAATIYPSTADQTIASYRWLTGTQTIKSVTTSNLTAENIAEGVVVKVGDSSNASRIAQITGTHSGGSGSYYSLINAIAKHKLIYSSGSVADGYTSTDVSEYFNSLSVLQAGNFANLSFSGSFTFNGLSYIPQKTFCFGPDIVHVLSTGKVFTINLPNTTNFGAYAFARNNHLASVIAPNCSLIRENCFEYCGFSQIILEKCTDIYYGAFQNCTYLTYASFSSSINTMQSSAFYSCSRLVSINITDCNSIGAYAFFGCNVLTTNISFPHCTEVNVGAFQGCWSIPAVSLPECLSIGSSAFVYCNNMLSAFLPKTKSLFVYAFSGCNKLSVVFLSECTNIYSSAFMKCYNLLRLDLTNTSSVPYLGNNVFSSTPISNYTTSTGGVYGSIFVPASLYNSYTTATNWATYSARIVSV